MARWGSVLGRFFSSENAFGGALGFGFGCFFCLKIHDFWPLGQPWGPLEAEGRPLLYRFFIDVWLILNWCWSHFKVNCSILNFQIFEFSKSVRNRPENTPKPSPNHHHTIYDFRCCWFVLCCIVYIIEKLRYFYYYFYYNSTTCTTITPPSHPSLRFWDGLGVFSGRFRTDFEKSKIREFRIEKLTLKWPQIHEKSIKTEPQRTTKGTFSWENNKKTPQNRTPARPQRLWG